MGRFSFWKHLYFDGYLLPSEWVDDFKAYLGTSARQVWGAVSDEETVDWEVDASSKHSYTTTKLKY